MANNNYNYTAIPDELKALKQWCCWKYVTVFPSNIVTKVPFQPHGAKASTTDPDTWASFDAAIAAVNNNNYDGIGFIFTKYDPYCGIDLDKIMSRDEATQILFEKIFKTFNSYTEWSPSETGLHIIIKAAVSAGVNSRELGCEIYSDGRFFTMTGNVIDNRPIEYRQELAEILYNDLIGNRKSSNSVSIIEAQSFSRPQEKDDGAVYDAACTASNGDLFKILWAGDWKGAGYPSQSEADFALINIIQFYSHNVEQVIRIFLLSGLGARDKARKRPEYVKRMAIRAFDNEQHLIDFSEIDNRHITQSAQSTHKKEETVLAPTPSFAPNVEPLNTDVFDAPSGLLGEIARFIYQASPRPVPEASLSAAIIMMAGICGKAFNVSNTGLNHYVLYLASSGTGKEAIAAGVSRLMHEVSYRVPGIMGFKGPADFASGQGLTRVVANSETGGSLFSIVGEFGLKMQGMAQDTAQQSNIELQRCLLDLYTKSGKTNVYDGKAYASKENNVKNINAPAFSMLGESVPTSFYANVDEKTVMSGLLPRFMLIEYNAGVRVPNNKFHASAKPTEELLASLSDLASMCLARIKHNSVYDIQLDYDASELDDEFDKYCDRKVNTTVREVFKYTYSRTRVKVLKLAALLAIGNNITNPIITTYEYNWAKKIILHETEALMRKFETGKIVNNLENLEVEQLTAVLHQLKYWHDRSDLKIKNGRTTYEMQQDDIYIISDLLQRMQNKAVYRRELRTDMAKKMHRALEMGKTIGFITEVNWDAPEIKARGYKTRARAIAITDYNGLVSYLDRNGVAE